MSADGDSSGFLTWDKRLHTSEWKACSTSPFDLAMARKTSSDRMFVVPSQMDRTCQEKIKWITVDLALRL